MCTLFGVLRNGHYAFVQRLGRPEKDAALSELIIQQRERNFGTYGLPTAVAENSKHFP